jgi:3-hydroxyacyl-[acyl-carrier-protein] dehydratase
MSETLGIEAIQALLPHRYPMLLVDRVLELEPGIRAVALKNVTMNEPFFQGHFPGMAVMPGVMIIEAMAQVAGIMMLACENYKGKVPFIAAIDSARFYQPVVPGDALVIEVTTVWVRSLLGKVDLLARVDGNIVVKSEMKFALKDPPHSREIEHRG